MVATNPRIEQVETQPPYLHALSYFNLKPLIVARPY
jgi:hypothetical protein